MEEKKYPKFLLYIREPRFNKEPRKSELVTRLLTEHYDRLEAGDKPKNKKIAGASPKKVIKTPAEAVSGLKHIIEDKPTINADQNALDGVRKAPDIEFCKHGAMPGFCKHPKCPNWKRP